MWRKEKLGKRMLIKVRPIYTSVLHFPCSEDSFFSLFFRMRRWGQVLFLYNKG